MKQIRLLLFDVDGVLTDGTILVHGDGTESKQFNIRDGAGIVWAQRAGLSIGILSARSAEATAVRAAQLGIDVVVQGSANKLAGYEQILRDKALTDAPNLTIEFAQGSTITGRSSPPLDKPDERGRITCVATFPADGFAPGTYELRAIARQGASQDETRTTFTIVE